MSEPIEKTKAELRAAFDDLLGELAAARDAIDQPELMPAPANERNLAEGYRYLMGFVHSAIERAFHEDPKFPFVRNALSILNRATIDNADAIYFAAAIDGHDRYLIRGRSGAVSPRYIIFEVTSGDMAGDSGSLMELRPGTKAQTGMLDSRELQLDADGDFEILLAPERPAGHSGNFISTFKRSKRAEHPDRYASYVSGRQLFYDWEHEEPVQLSVVPLDRFGEHPPAYDPATAAAQLRRMGALVRSQMHFWNQFYTVLLQTYGAKGAERSRYYMPRNSFNEPNAASGDTGGGQRSNIYAGGVFELEPDEALLVESRLKVEPQYIGFHLGNLWGESLDYANHQSSLNGQQMHVGADGVLRWVVAHRDPGVQNWLDTTGHREGFLTPRWTYSVTPPEDQWPTIQATRLRFDEIDQHFPADARRVTPQQRREQIAIRQLHVQRRFRVF